MSSSTSRAPAHESQTLFSSQAYTHRPRHTRSLLSAWRHRQARLPQQQQRHQRQNASGEKGKEQPRLPQRFIPPPPTPLRGPCANAVPLRDHRRRPGPPVGRRPQHRDMFQIPRVRTRGCCDLTQKKGAQNLCRRWSLHCTGMQAGFVFLDGGGV